MRVITNKTKIATLSKKELFELFRSQYGEDIIRIEIYSHEGDAVIEEDGLDVTANLYFPPNVNTKDMDHG